MSRTAWITAILLGVGVATVAAWDISVKIEPSLAQADSPAAPALWTDGESDLQRPGRSSFADLAEAMSPAVVSIEVPHSEEREQFLRRRRGRNPGPASQGSGFTISSDGYIVTNNHVVAGAKHVDVVFNDGTRLSGGIVGTDRETDLALIKVDSESELPVAPLGNSENIRVGDWVMAIGNPLGFDHSVTVGILSARGRRLGQNRYENFLQTDASINRGNSGGPLIDMNGNVIGINSMMLGGAENLGFAIPINMAKELLPQLRESGYVTRGWLGVQIQDVTADLAEQFGLDRPRGALVSQVFEDSPAAGANVKAGDIIVRFNDYEIKSFQDLPARVAATAPGSKVEIVVLRDGKEKKLKAKLETLEMASATPPARAPELSSFDDWGFEAEDMTSEMAERLGLDKPAGVVITKVEPGSPAQRGDLNPGDVIVEANKGGIDSVSELGRVLEKVNKDGKSRILLLIRRGDNTSFITLARE